MLLFHFKINYFMSNLSLFLFLKKVNLGFYSIELVFSSESATYIDLVSQWSENKINQQD